MNDNIPSFEIALLKARLEFGAGRVVDDLGDWIALAGGLTRIEGGKVDRERLEQFRTGLDDLAASCGLQFTGSVHLLVNDEVDGGPPELDP